MGRATIPQGTDPRKALTMKIVGNSMILGLTELLGEVHVFGEAAGLGSDKIEEWINELFGPFTASYSQRITKGVYQPAANADLQFSADNALKDGGHAVNIANSVGAKLPIMELFIEHLKQAKEAKGSHLDCAAVYGTLRVKAGMDFENAAVKERQSKE